LTVPELWFVSDTVPVELTWTVSSWFVFFPARRPTAATPGSADPALYTVRNPVADGLIALISSTTESAVAGIENTPAAGNVTVPPAGIGCVGTPPVPYRVSSTRTIGTLTNCPASGIKDGPESASAGTIRKPITAGTVSATEIAADKAIHSRLRSHGEGHGKTTLSTAERVDMARTRPFRSAKVAHHHPVEGRSAEL
jgi:hypothetical protein